MHFQVNIQQEDVLFFWPGSKKPPGFPGGFSVIFESFYCAFTAVLARDFALVKAPFTATIL